MCGFVLPTFSLPSCIPISEFEVVEGGLGYYNYHIKLIIKINGAHPAKWCVYSSTGNCRLALHSNYYSRIIYPGLSVTLESGRAGVNSV